MNSYDIQTNLSFKKIKKNGKYIEFFSSFVIFKHSDKIISEKGSQNAKNRTDIISNASKFADWLYLDSRQIITNRAIWLQSDAIGCFRHPR